MKYKVRYDMMGKLLQEIISNEQDFVGFLVVEIKWFKFICTVVLQFFFFEF